MSLTLTSYPVSGTEGNYLNIFPSQKPIYAFFERADAEIDTIVSGTDGVVRMTASEDFTDVGVGDYVTWVSGGYSLRSSLVIAIISADTIEVEDSFVSSDASNSFVNFKKNWFAELRFVAQNTTTDNQSAIELTPDYNRVPSSKNGTLKIPLNTLGQMLTPDFSGVSGNESGLSVEFKVQYRESWEGHRSELWVSPTPDVKMLLVHGTTDFTKSGQLIQLNEGWTYKYAKGYPFFFTFIHSDVNDSGLNQMEVFLQEYGIAKTLIAETSIFSQIDVNGVYVVSVDTSTLDSDTRFIQFRQVLSSASAQYDPSQYDPSQYA